jgi:hypothetical protein
MRRWRRRTVKAVSDYCLYIALLILIGIGINVLRQQSEIQRKLDLLIQKRGFLMENGESQWIPVKKEKGGWNERLRLQR